MTTPLDPAPRAAPARALLPAALLALGLAAGGALAGAGVARMRTSDRTVSVRGVSEREARADLAIWPLHIVAADDDLAAANASIARQLATVRTFLSEHGLDENGPGERGRATAGPAATQITLGGIRSASQGSVEILPRDQAPGISEESQLLKIVRVVTTVDYAIR